MQAASLADRPAPKPSEPTISATNRRSVSISVLQSQPTEAQNESLKALKRYQLLRFGLSKNKKKGRRVLNRFLFGFYTGQK